MPYGEYMRASSEANRCELRRLLVRLGNSGLKVSKIILGTMQYGDSNWQQWVLDEDKAIEHIKYACVSQFSLTLSAFYLHIKY